MWLQNLIDNIKYRIGSIALVIGIAVGAGVCLFWMTLVGNPHVAETFFGLGLSVIIGALVFWNLRKWAKPRR